MKITALGVNSAFATGGYERVILEKDAIQLFMKLARSPEFKDASEAEIKAALHTFSKRAYFPKWHSNFLVEFDTIGKRGKRPYRLLIDAGADVRHALKGLGLTANDIDGVYISHPHSDHIGGVEYLGIITLFNPNYTPAKKDWLGDLFIVDKLFVSEVHPQHQCPGPPASARPDLFIHRKVLEPLKRAVGPGLDTVQGVPNVDLDTYFDVHLIGKQENGQVVTHIFQEGEEEWMITPVFAMHVISSSEEMASYGISFQHSSGYNILMPTDTQHMMPPQLTSHYKRANRIYMDCETGDSPSGVHPHILDLVERMSPDIQQKCLLYHYDEYPVAPEGMFCGILKVGDSHVYP